MAPSYEFSLRAFFTKVAGVTFEGRQRIVARCSEGERLTLLRDPNNPHDSGAIKVMRLNGEQLGFLSADVSRGGNSSGLAYRMDRGDMYQCRISSLTGGGRKNLGVNIEITEGEFDESVHVNRVRVETASTPSNAVAVLWVLGVIVIVCLLWAASK